MTQDGAHGTTATLARGGVTDARIAAADILADLRGGDLLDAAFERRTAGLEARDRRWLHELVFGLLRRRGFIDAALAPRMHGGLARSSTDLIDLLRLGVYQLFFMASVPSYAAIAQTVELAKQRHGIGASKLANAVLRRIDREREQLEPSSDAAPGRAPGDETAAALAERFSHPEWLAARWISRMGADDAASLMAWNNTEAPLVLRPFGIDRSGLVSSLEDSGVQVAPVVPVPDSVQVVGPIALTELGAFRRGQFFVQDPAATLVTRYAAVPPGAIVADLCGAPGGKSLELSRSASLVVCADRSEARLTRVRANVERLHASGIALAAMDVRAPALAPLPAVLLDAPCTGTGTFRRHPDARWRLRISDLAVLAATQRLMLAAAALCVEPGGLLVYSTCSLEPEENDEQIAHFLAGRSDFVLEPPPPGAVPDRVLDRGLLRVVPTTYGTDGAFAARLRRAA